MGRSTGTGPKPQKGVQDPYPPRVYLGAPAPLAVLDFWPVRFPASLGTFGSAILLLWGLDSQLAGLDTSPDIFDLHWWLLQVHSLHWLDLGSKAGQRGDPVYIAASLVFRIRVMAQLTAETRLMRQRVTRAARAASEAAQALRGANAQQLEKPTGILRPTEQCSVQKIGYVVSSEVSSGWNDVSFAFKQWLCVCRCFFTLDLDFEEEHGDVGVTFTETIEIVCYFV